MAEENTIKPAEQLMPVEPPKKKVDITEQEKEEFFKSFMAEQNYQQTFPLFGNKANVVFRTLTNKENSNIIKQIVVDQKSGLSANNDAYFITIMSYRLGLAIVSIDGHMFQPDLTEAAFKPEKDDDSTYVRKRSMIFDDWPIFKLSAIQEAYRMFEEKVLALTSEIQNPNFWKAAA